MDSKVLRAQKWVNATYSGVSGYSPVQEDGITGWATMSALTRALQHELGITALSDNFGLATLNLLTQRGGVKLTEPNSNIIRIVQCGCFCKGYDPGSISGAFDGSTRSAVSRLAVDAGLSAIADAIAPKLVKALLTMDAYTLSTDGSPAVRTVQQWLNRQYWTRSNYFLAPCHGVPSRQGQLALCLALQYELGIADDQVTGTFGPKTRAGVKDHPLARGATGVFVRLLTAAMVCYRVRLHRHSAYELFTDTFDDRVAQGIRKFQIFTALPADGEADYATWCELLVSNGDPDRQCTAIDCITTITDERAATLAASGYAIVGRYLDERPSAKPLNKRIQPGELDVIFRHGLRVFPISQYNGGSAAYFTRDQGIKDAEEAHAAAVKHGFRPGTVIYFAVDFDATQTDIDNNVIAYFEGVVAGLAGSGHHYRHGVYGSRNVCSEVSERTGARWSFVAGMSTGHSGNVGFPLPENWTFNQVKTVTLGTGAGAIEVDRNAHRPGTDAGVGSVNQPESQR
jgi:peptidoglycan hydrolase-like protein with peptidoglycan-binding domain